MVAWLMRSLYRRGEATAAEVSAAELAASLDSSSPPVLIDIRSAGQFAAAHLPGAVHIPLDRLGAEAARLHPSAPAVVY